MTVALFTTKTDSTLSSFADHLVVFPIGDGAVKTAQHAGSLFEQSCFLVGDAIAADIKERLAVDDETMNPRHFNLY